VNGECSLGREPQLLPGQQLVPSGAEVIEQSQRDRERGRLEAVLALAPKLRASRAITSGYLVSDEPELEGYRRERRVQSGGWAADLHGRG